MIPEILNLLHSFYIYNRGNCSVTATGDYIAIWKPGAGNRLDWHTGYDYNSR